MQNLRLAPDEEGDDLYAGFELNEGLWNVSYSPVRWSCGHHCVASLAQTPPVPAFPLPLGGVGPCEGAG